MCGCCTYRENCKAVSDTGHAVMRYQPNHVMTLDYRDIKIIGGGADAADFALINLCHKEISLLHRIME